MAAKPAEERKRKASTALRALAVELHVGNRGRSNDLTKSQFATLFNNVLPLCSTPEQRRCAQEAKALFDAAPVVLPHIPALPLVTASAPSSSASAVALSAANVRPPTPEEKEFRLRGRSCLFTYNSLAFSVANASEILDNLLLFLASHW